MKRIIDPLHCLLRCFCLVFVIAGLSFVSNRSYSQAVMPQPGGITDALYPKVVSWFSPEGTPCSNCNVATITPKKGNTPTALVASPAVVHQTPSQNFNPAIVTSGGGWLDWNRAGTPSFNGDRYEIILVTSTAFAGANNSDWELDPSILGTDVMTGSNERLAVKMMGGNFRYCDDQSQTTYRFTSAANTYNDSRPHIVVISRDKQGGATNDSQGIIDGGTSLAFNSHNATINDFAKFVLSNDKAKPGTCNYSGKFGDVIIVDETLTVAQRQRVETYLALKYGITLAHDYLSLQGATTAVTKLYELDLTFDNQIFGIGRADSTDFYQRMAYSSGEGVPSFVAYCATGIGSTASYPLINDNTAGTITGNNKFQIFGNNNGTRLFDQTFAGVANARMARTWKVTDVGAMPAITLWFDDALNNLGGPGNYYLCYGRDPGLGMGETFKPLLSDGNAGHYVEIDFRNNDTTYFTITKNNTFVGPAGIANGLEFWVRSDSGIAPTPAVISSWKDISGNGHDLAMGAAAGSWGTTPSNINYHADLKGGAVNQQWSTASKWRGRTIIAVGKASGGQNGDGYMGFNNNVGIRQVTATANQLGTSGAADWTNTPGFMRSNGAVNATPSITDYSVLYAERSALYNRENFYLGGYFAGAPFTTYDFGEVMVYDTVLSPTEILKMESYLGLRFGITLSHDYQSSSGSTYYVVSGGYGNQIAGIGIDTQGKLRQKQGRSNSASSLVSLALGSHSLYDSVNSNTFEADNKFMVFGHNGNMDNCWSSLDLNVSPAEQGIYWRIGREWKMEYSGTWATDAVQVRFYVDEPGFDIPNLPSGATDFYMFVDQDNNFANGGTTAMLMNSPSTGIWEASLPAAALPSTSPFYFTFGTKLDSVAMGHVTRCKGSTFKVYGSLLANECAYLTLSRPSSVHNAVHTALNANTATTFKIDVDNPGGCIDTLSWMVPPTALTGVHDLFVDTTGAGINCPLGSVLDVKGGIVRQVTVDTGEVANIVWPGIDTTYCLSGGNVFPTFGAGCSPGLYSYFSGPLSGNPNAIMPNTTTGELLAHAGSVGTHVIRFVTTGGSTCKDTADAIVRIQAIATPTIVYPASPFCGGAGFTAPPTITGRPTNGVFSSDPGLWINGATGVVNLPISTPGTHTVFYTPHPDSCGTVATTTVVINAPERAYFEYIDSVYCLGAPDALPFIQYRPTTGTFGGVPLTVGSITINSATGAVDLTATTAGSYIISYSGIVGSCTFAASDTITVKANRDASFSLPNDTLCLSNASFIPTRPDISGYFTSNGLINISVDSLTINPSLSTAGGPYNLSYTVPDAYCPDTTTQQMYFRGIAAASLTFSDTVICQNGTNPYPIFNTGTSGGVFFSNNVNTSFVSTTTGEVNVSAMPPGNNYDIRYTAPDPLCPSTFLIATLQIDAVPDPTFGMNADSLCENSGPNPLDVLPSSGGTPSYSLYIGPNLIPGAFTGSTLNVDSLTPGGPFMMQNIQTLGACSDTAFDFITIVEQDTASIQFVPDIICIGGNNPFPLITGDGGGIFALGPNAPFPLYVSPDSGIVYLIDTMVLDTYSVVYTTQGYCSDVDTAFVEVRDNQTASFDYADGKVCQTDTALLSPTQGFSLGGIFTSTPAGLDMLDDSLGVISISTSLADTFAIAYNLSSAGSCISTFTDQIIIVKRDTSTTMTYFGSPYCPSDQNPIPQLNGSLPNEGLFSAPGLYFSNQDSGIVALASSPAGTYEITFSKLTVCEEEFFDTIVIKPSAGALFDYPSVIYCISPTVPKPAFVSNYGGVFSGYNIDSTAQLLPITADSGFIDLVNAAEGNYLVTYTIAPNGSACGGSHSVEVRILPQPTNVDMFPNTDDSICARTYVFFTATGADLISWVVNGDTSNQTGTFFEADSLLDSGDVVTAIFNTLEGCKDTRSVTMHVFDIPDAFVNLAPQILAGNDAISIEMTLLTDNTWLNWTVSGIGAIRFDSLSGRSAEGDAGDPMPLGNTVYVDEDFQPAEFTYLITPRTFLCKGKTDTVTVKVNPNDRPIFIPQVMTPDGNGYNDQWLIQWKLDVDPSLYTIKLYNSAGALVHTMSPLDRNFDGRNSDAGYLPDGVYWYVLLNQKGEKEDAGGLTIIRRK